MTDRSLIADARAAARRTSGQPEPALRERVTDAIRDEWSKPADHRSTNERFADAAIAVIGPELDKADRHVEELQDKLLSFGDNGGCCCSYEGPGDVCLSHSPTVRQLTAEREQLRANLRTAAGLLRDTAERTEQQRTVNAGVLRGAAKAIDEITGGQP